MAALVAAGLAAADELVTEISLEEDAAERDRFFSGLLEESGTPPTA